MQLGNEGLGLGVQGERERDKPMGGLKVDLR